MFQQFVDRGAELKFLEDMYKDKRANLFILYGRRRVGKTELIKQFIKNKKHIYFLADSRTDYFNIKELQGEMGNYLNNDLFKIAKIDDWFGLFEEFTKIEKEKVIICIDEFPYLIDSNKAIPSIFQKIWDLLLSKTDVFLILCGSSVSMMENYTLSPKSPLYGRRTGQWKLQPMKFKYMRSFLPYSIEDLIKAYSLTGGIPLYILELDGKLNFSSNLKEKVFRPGKILYLEAEILLREEFREPANYFSILKAIAFGRNKYGEICSFTTLDKSIVSKYLENLILIGIIKKEFPVTQRKETRNAGYVFKDNYFNFWFRFIYPNKSEIEIGEVDICGKIKEDFNQYLGFIFEKVCMVFLIDNRRLLPLGSTKIGRWWHKEKEIDIVSLDEDKKQILFVECKWKNLKERQAIRILEDLKGKSKSVDWNLYDRKEWFGLIAKNIEGKNRLRKEGFVVFDLDDF